MDPVVLSASVLEHLVAFSTRLMHFSASRHGHRHSSLAFVDQIEKGRSHVVHEQMCREQSADEAGLPSGL